ncbi:MAG: hypothetical protein IJP61_01110 [Treponema sp.]|jgi:hypothetical protein|nr:hypothetical protein [Treponema sp.]MBR0030879.1 hypothetical protein [Treponema sp.]
MPEALIQMYETLDEQEQKEVYDFTMYLLSKKDAKKNASREHLKKFFGTISEEEANEMLEAVKECRRIEPNEW